MALSVWEVFLALFGGGEDAEEESDEEEAESRFVPSPLDLSVRIGEMSERAEEIEEERGN
jgi:hypothetical protein